jgi:purine nucleosidase
MPGERRRIIIDCDPGQDDAINLFLALAATSELELVGLTTVAGNVPLPFTTRNARLICDLADRADVAIHAGCASPLRRVALTAESVHGESGLGDLDIGRPQTALASTAATAFLAETLASAPRESITLVATGPLTNLAAAFAERPDCLAGVAEVVLMGGAFREAGNYSPCAEFNVIADPEAAARVFGCGRPLTVAGLDLTHQVVVTPARRLRFEALKSPAGRAVGKMLDFFQRHAPARCADGFPLHDPCTIAYLLAPALFEGRHCNLEVETESTLTLGHTVVDYWGVTSRPPNVNWLYRAEVEAVFDLLLDMLKRFEKKR